MADKVLVVGGTGLVGNALVRNWTAAGAVVAAATYHCHRSGGFHQLDMQDVDGVRALLAEYRPTLVAVPAANPFVDYCELHPAETRKVNVDGTWNVARACREIGARMIFYSSDYVYDGVKGVYTEEDAPNPINEYGRQKAEAEAGVLAADSGNLVIRTSGAYGWQWEPKNFVLQIRARLAKGETMRVADDLRYNPTYVENLAQITVALSSRGASGIFHVVGAEEIVRYEFAARVAAAFGLDAGLLIPTPMANIGSPTPRPKASSLRTDKVRAAVSVHPIGVDEGLRRMLAMEADWRAYARTLPDPAAKTAPIRR
ncbi:MAG: NAD(P)-dependent oxidoreductase [Elusimicrobia bacterium]|nr:NAD(P)-dependent oxidoreductase [Elusimicrobiota bacterium]